jgi:hypothetical protein
MNKVIPAFILLSAFSFTSFADSTQVKERDRQIAMRLSSTDQSLTTLSITAESTGSIRSCNNHDDPSGCWVQSPVSSTSDIISQRP